MRDAKTPERRIVLVHDDGWSGRRSYWLNSGRSTTNPAKATVFRSDPCFNGWKPVYRVPAGRRVVTDSFATDEIRYWPAGNPETYTFKLPARDLEDNYLGADVTHRWFWEERLGGEWKCPIDSPECTKSCGSYGCGS